MADTEADRLCPFCECVPPEGLLLHTCRIKRVYEACLRRGGVCPIGRGKSALPSPNCVYSIGLAEPSCPADPGQEARHG